MAVALDSGWERTGGGVRYRKKIICCVMLASSSRIVSYLSDKLRRCVLLFVAREVSSENVSTIVHATPQQQGQDVDEP